MYVKFPPGDLNPGFCPPPHPTSTYTCRMTIAPKMCDDEILILKVGEA